MNVKINNYINFYVKNIAQDKISGKQMSNTQHGVMQRKTMDRNWKGIKREQI
jgi:hypothetical protein